ncbi:MAG: ATP-dependent DNA helicase RecG [Bacteroidota bacterium]|nr:ATP-dependent DNA helicase RecG [Bacteroidota bacterium]
MPTSSRLLQPPTVLPAIGKHRAKALETVGIRTIRDLLYYVPRRYLDRSTIVPMTDLHRCLNQNVTCIGRVSGMLLMGRTRLRLVVTLRDEHGSMDIVFFHGLPYWKEAFSHDEVIAVSGTITQYGRRPNMVHPEIDRLQDEESFEFINTGGIIPVYPSSAELERVGLNRRAGFRRIIREALNRFAEAVEDPLESHSPDGIRARHALVPLRTAITHIHRPPSHEALTDARRRLVFDEFFALALRQALRKRHTESTPGIAFQPSSPTARALVERLPFTLTRAQRKVLHEIISDLARSAPMNRLLQGDVGSGKTVVALLAMLLVVDNGYQAAMMVPTEILAEQHMRTVVKLTEGLGVPVHLLVGQQPPSYRARVMEALAAGIPCIVIGTHALIESGVVFGRLGLAVIDEQHRFGVLQRAALRRKGPAPDVLVMTATPIPRTLTMTLYGDLDVSVIDELPANRRNITTAVRFEEDRPRVWNFIRSEVKRGNRAYIVLPLVSESEKLDLKAATQEYEMLAAGEFRDLRVGLLHGQMPSREKDETMERFVRGEIDILVTTSVVEVGVDVPDATVMVIEHAERFGLAQLHQLRGRVGRSEKQGYCILMTDKRIFSRGKSTPDEQIECRAARLRLETIRDTLDGFRIAEADFTIRGPGDLWGTQQSGFPQFRVADLRLHGDILREARDEAFRIVARDPHLRAPEHAGLRELTVETFREDMEISTTA